MLSEVVNEKQYRLELTNEEDYEITVMSCAGDEENVFGSTSQDVLTLTRLKSVEIKIRSGVVSWEDSQTSAQGYKVEIYNANDLDNPIQTERVERNASGLYRYDELSNIINVNTDYSIKVTTLGDNNNNATTSGMSPVSVYVPSGVKTSVQTGSSSQDRQYSRTAVETQYGVSKTQVNDLFRY